MSCATRKKRHRRVEPRRVKRQRCRRPGQKKRETTDIEKYSMIGRGDADQSKHDVEVTRILRMHGANIPDPEDVMEVENRRMSYDGSATLGDSLIILTDIETGFFRQCVTEGGGGWYGRPNRRHLEKYGLNSHEYNKSAFKEEHIPVVEERERDNLVVRLIYRESVSPINSEHHRFR